MGFIFKSGGGGGSGGLEEITQALSNNQSGASITGVNLNSSTVKRAIIYMSYGRTLDSGLVRQGIELEMIYDGAAWNLFTGEISGDDGTGVTFSNTGGQLEYDSTNDPTDGTGNFSYYVRTFSE